MITDYDIFKDEKNSCFQLSTHSVSYAIEFDNSEKETIFLEAVSLLQEKEDLSLSQLTKALTKNASEDKVHKVAFIRDGKMTGIPLDTSTFKEQLPGSKKIVTKYDENVKNILTDYNYYTTSDENVHIFCNGKDKSILNTIAKYTHNFSIQDTDIQDAYLYNTKNI